VRDGDARGHAAAGGRVAGAGRAQGANPRRLAIVSSLRGRPLPDKLVVFGEVGLAGEVRPVARGQERLREAAKLGFERAIVPRGNRPKQAIPGLRVAAVGRIDEAIAALRNLSDAS
jgi:DNA repair protein RadA/Sms